MSRTEKSVEIITSRGLPIQVRTRGTQDYLQTQSEMQQFVAGADESTNDQIWLLQHPPTYTQGTACTQQPFNPIDIPLVQSDRGGQITYHGPGQIVLYPLLALRRHGLSVKGLVSNLEQAVIDLLSDYQILAERRQGAPGIYVSGAKIAALGLRIRKGWSYHGLSLNVYMDLTPFNNIDPCGYAGLKATQMVDESKQIDIDHTAIGQNLVKRFCALL